MEASLFELIAGRIQQSTDLDALEARGTVRIALKEAGLEPRSVTGMQMAVMLEKTMPRELAARGVADAEALCTALTAEARRFQGAPDADRVESPEDVFRRLGGR